MFQLKMKNHPIVLVNPVIKNLSDEKSIYEEGCLSIPETFVEIERPKICELYIDEKGSKLLNAMDYYPLVFNMK